jgi:nitroimidazol reductase NimA-like FMN-containing flavoprotein (pyridoxamine 5'-phosphate oxidase superfamily)
MMNVIKAQDMCVLATVDGEVPHCSLMAYVSDETCRKVYMITHRNTKKYANLLANPAVCLLIDTRLSAKRSSRETVQALTVNGTFELVRDEEAAGLRNRFIEAHPHLREFAQDDDAQVFAVKLQALQLLRDATDAAYANLEEE